MAAAIDVSDGAQLVASGTARKIHFSGSEASCGALLANHVPQSQLSEISGFGVGGCSHIGLHVYNFLSFLVSL